MARIITVSAALLTLTGCVEVPEEGASVEVNAFVSDASGFDTSTYWVDTGAEVIVFDAQFTPSLAEEMLAEIKAATANPVRYVVVTHPNPDKFNGATVFQAAGAKLVASEATAAAMPGVHDYKEAYFVGAGAFGEGEYPRLPEVDVTFSGELSLALDGDVGVTLYELSSPGVSSTQTVAVAGDADAASVFVGDLVAHKAHAWLEGGIVDGLPRPDLGLWIDALDELDGLADSEAAVYPGRGESGALGQVVNQQQAYLETMDALVGDYVLGLTDAAGDLTGDASGDHYAAITAEAEAAYPTYGLSYLVTYGVYGLALTKAGAF